MSLIFDEIAISVAPLFLVIFAGIIAVAWWRTQNLSYVMCVVVFGIYGLFVLDRVFFPMHLGGEYIEITRERPLFSDVYLMPFDFGQFGTLQSSLQTLFLNVLLTIPFGFGISFIAPIRPKMMLWLVPAAGISLELMQLLLTVLLQYPYRIVDIHDVLMNTLGVLAGYALFSLFAWSYVALTHWLNITHYGLSRYVFDVSSRAVPVTTFTSSAD